MSGMPWRQTRKERVVYKATATVAQALGTERGNVAQAKRDGGKHRSSPLSVVPLSAPRTLCINRTSSVGKLAFDDVQRSIVVQAFANAQDRLVDESPATRFRDWGELAF